MLWTHHGKVSDTSGRRQITKKTIYNCTGSGSMFKIFRIKEVPYTEFVYDYSRAVHQLTRLMCLNMEEHQHYSPCSYPAISPLGGFSSPCCTKIVLWGFLYMKVPWTLQTNKNKTVLNKTARKKYCTVYFLNTYI